MKQKVGLTTFLHKQKKKAYLDSPTKPTDKKPTKTPANFVSSATDISAKVDMQASMKPTN